MTGNTTHPSPNYVDPPTKAPMVLGAIISLTILAMAFVVARISVKTKLKKLGLEDFLIVVAMVLSLVITICMCISCGYYGLGRHNWDVPPEWFSPSAKLRYSFIALYNPVLIFYKTSILTFYLRLAPHQGFRRTCYVFIVYISCSSMAIFLINVFGCRPISGGWNVDPHIKAVCVNKAQLYIISGLNNILTDIVLLVLPVPIIMGLNLASRVKLGLVLLFSMGFLVTAVSIIRLYMVHVAMYSSDYSWDGAYSSMWSSIELSVAIMTACMPAMKLFLTWLFPSLHTTDSYHRRSNPSFVAGLENGTIGGVVIQMRPRPLDTTVGTCGNDSEECIIHGPGADVKSIEINTAPGSSAESFRVAESSDNNHPGPKMW